MKAPTLKSRGERRFTSLLWKVPVAEEVEEELAFHVEMQAREYERQGLAPDAARERSRARLGDARALARTCRRIAEGRDRTMRRQEWFSDLRQDLGFAARQIAKSPAAATLAALTLALGIGAATLIFSALYTVVLRPLPFAEPERLVVVATTWQGRDGNVSAGNYVYIAEHNRSLAGITATQAASFNLAEGDTPERVIGARVTYDYFTVLGLTPALGRSFLPEEDQPGHEHVAVLSHGLWKRRFGGDPGIVDRTVRLGGEGYRVIGVMPASLGFTLDGAELWVPIAFTPERRQMHDEHFLGVYGRLAPGVTLAQANDDLARVARDLIRDHPVDNQDRGAKALPLLEDVVGNARERLVLLQAAVGLLLLIACANVAGLLLARGSARAGELALRAALGSGRGRLARQLLTESLLLGLLGGAAGLGLAAVGLQVLVATAPAGIPRLAEARLDPATLGFALGVSLLSCLLFGLAPARELSRVDLRGSLAAGGRSAVGSGRGHRLRRALVAAEVALAVVLLVGSGLLIRTTANLARIAPGFEPAGLLTARLALPESAYPGAEAPQQTFTAIVDRLAASPGVSGAAAASQPPLVGGGTNGLLREGLPPEPQNVIDSRSQFVTLGYFETLRIPLRAGRFFDRGDRQGAARVMIVNETLAKTLFPGESPLGQRVYCCEGSAEDPRYKEVVGVVADTRSGGPARAVRPEFYLPLAQMPPVAWDWIQRTMVLVARADGVPPESLAAGVRQAVRATDPTLPLYDVATMPARFDRASAPARFNTLLLTVFGLLGLALSAIGLYGVIAHAVGERRREIGVRMALGANPASVLGFVLRQGMGAVLAGLGIGTLAAVLASRALKAFLVGIAPGDPLTLAAVVVLLLGVALAASLVPARRATRIDPARTLMEG